MQKNNALIAELLLGRLTTLPPVVINSIGGHHKNGVLTFKLEPLLQWATKLVAKN